MLIAITIAFYHQEIKVKGIIVFIIVFVYTLLTNKVKPFKLKSKSL